MKKIIICLIICCIGTMVFAGPRDRRGRDRYRNPPRHYGHGHRHRHDHNDGLYIANGVLGIVDKSLRILTGPNTVVVTQPMVVQPTQQVVVQPSATQIVQINGINYAIFIDANGRQRLVPITAPIIQ